MCLCEVFAHLSRGVFREESRAHISGHFPEKHVCLHISQMLAVVSLSCTFPSFSDTTLILQHLVHRIFLKQGYTMSCFK